MNHNENLRLRPIAWIAEVKHIEDIGKPLESEYIEDRLVFSAEFFHLLGKGIFRVTEMDEYRKE